MDVIGMIMKNEDNRDACARDEFPVLGYCDVDGHSLLQLFFKT